MSSCGLLSWFVIAAISSAAHAGTILYVDDDAPLNGDGLSWDTAFRFLQDALADAAASGGAVPPPACRRYSLELSLWRHRQDSFHLTCTA